LFLNQFLFCNLIMNLDSLGIAIKEWFYEYDGGVTMIHLHHKVFCSLAHFVGNAGINSRDKEGFTLLHYACIYEKNDKIRWLIDEGAIISIGHEEEIKPPNFYCNSFKSLKFFIRRKSYSENYTDDKQNKHIDLIMEKSFQLPLLIDCIKYGYFTKTKENTIKILNYAIKSIKQGHAHSTKLARDYSEYIETLLSYIEKTEDIQILFEFFFEEEVVLSDEQMEIYIGCFLKYLPNSRDVSYLEHTTKLLDKFLLNSAYYLIKNEREIPPQLIYRFISQDHNLERLKKLIEEREDINNVFKKHNPNTNIETCNTILGHFLNSSDTFIHTKKLFHVILEKVQFFYIQKLRYNWTDAVELGSQYFQKLEKENSILGFNNLLHNLVYFLKKLEKRNQNETEVSEEITK